MRVAQLGISAQTVFNLSKKILTHTEIRVLEKGLDFKTNGLKQNI